MKKSSIAGIISLALIFVLGLVFTGCEQVTGLGPRSSDPTVKHVVVAGFKTATVGVPSEDWVAATETAGHIFVGNISLKNAEVGVEGVAENSTVYFAQAKANVQPTFVTGTTFTFADNDFLFVEVFSANRDKYVIYAIQVHNRNPGVADITLGGRSAAGGKNASGSAITSFGKVGIPAASPEAVTVEQEGQIWFGNDQEGATLALTVKPEDVTSTIRVATASGNAAPVFEGDFLPANGSGIIPGLFADVSNGDYLYVEVKSSYAYGGYNAYVDNGYYKFKMVSKKNDRSLTGAKIVWYEGATKKGEIPLEIGQMGTVSMTGSESYGSYVGGPELAAVPPGSPPGTISGSIATITEYLNRSAAIPDNFRAELVLAPTDSDLKLEYDWIKNQRDGSLAFDKTSDLGRLIGGNWLLVQATSELGEKGWYKFLLNAGNNSTTLGSLKINGTDVAIPTVNTAVTGGANTPLVLNVSDLASIKVEAAAPNGFESPIAIGLAPTLGTSLGTVVFDVNAAEGLDTFSAVEPGQVIVIRVLPENSVEFYGGSGAAPIWQDSTQPNAGVTGGVAVARYYKVWIGAGSRDTSISGITFNGTSTGGVPEGNNVLGVSSYSAPAADKKGNILVTETSGLGVNTYNKADYATAVRTDITINAVPTAPGATVDYAWVAGPFAKADAAITPPAGKEAGVYYDSPDGVPYTTLPDTGTVLPATFNGTGVFADIAPAYGPWNGGTFYIRVTAESKVDLKLYALYITP
ncbi:MAG: hypothetical protein LBN21_05075 [Treponema sp.]|nr:hypothetical protein [Treponema sp.]